MADAWIYPRTISIRRPNKNSGTAGGVKPFGGVAPKDETVVATGLPASIQFDRIGSMTDANLPADARGSGSWKIFIPLESAALGTIQRDDIVVDDLGVRYLVADPYWNSWGYALRGQSLVV